MIAYLRKLNSAVVEDRAQQEKDRRHRVIAAKERLVPLEDRLARLLASIPDEVQREGLSLPALQAGLRGRWRGNCHPGELGAALRRGGFIRQRLWGSNVGFRAVWIKTS